MIVDALPKVACFRIAGNDRSTVLSSGRCFFEAVEAKTSLLVRAVVMAFDRFLKQEPATATYSRIA